MERGTGVGTGEPDVIRVNWSIHLTGSYTTPSNAALAIAECDKALCEGGDEELQLLNCCLRIRQAMSKP